MTFQLLAMLPVTYLLLCATGLAISLTLANGDVTFRQKVPNWRFDEEIARVVKVTRVSLVRAKNHVLIVPHYAVHIETDREGWELFGDLCADDSMDHEVYEAWDNRRTAPKELAIADEVALAKGRKAALSLPGNGYWTLAELIGCTGGVPCGASGKGKPVHSCMDFAWYMLQVAVGTIKCGACADAPTSYNFVKARSGIRNRAQAVATLLDAKGNRQARVDGVLLTQHALDAI